MTEALPEIPCTDYWPAAIPPEKARAYRQMIDAGVITRPTVVVSRSAGSRLVGYRSAIPHDWILQEMGRISREGVQEVIG